MTFTGRVLTAFIVGLSAATSRAQNLTYYVSNLGNDTASGTSSTTPWRTLAHVSNFDTNPGFQAGDSILLERGSVWNEISTLMLHSNGSSSAKITLGEYGTATAPAIISRQQRNASLTCAIVTGSHWLIQRIQFEYAQRGLEFNAVSGPGADVEVDDCYFRYIDDRTNDQDPSVGILFDGFGCQDVNIRGCTFDHVTNGVSTQTGTFNTNFVIDRCEAFGGWGCGFSLTNIHGGRLSNSRVHDVGGLCTNGSCGGFMVNSANVVVSNCSFSGVRHGGGPDGVGFDFESNNMDCELRDSLIYDNEGPAILMFSGGNLPNIGTIVADCLFYNNNTVPHGGTSGEDTVLRQAGSPVSEGTLSNCGVYKNGNSTDWFGGAWSGFSSTGVLTGTHCTGWTPVYGRFRHLSVGGNGHICAVDLNHLPQIWTGNLTGNCWKTVSGLTTAARVSVGNDGDLWATDTSGGVWHYDGNVTWTQHPSVSFTKLTVGSAANVWGINSSHQIFHWVSPNWGMVSGTLTDIEVGPAIRDVWGLNGTTVMHYDSVTGWSSVSGALTQISDHGSAGTNDIIAGVNGTTILRTIDGGTSWHTLPGSLIEVSEGSDGTLWGIDVNGYVWRSN